MVIIGLRSLQESSFETIVYQNMLVVSDGKLIISWAVGQLARDVFFVCWMRHV